MARTLITPDDIEQALNMVRIRRETGSLTSWQFGDREVIISYETIIGFGEEGGGPVALTCKHDGIDRDFHVGHEIIEDHKTRHMNNQTEPLCYLNWPGRYVFTTEHFSNTTDRHQAEYIRKLTPHFDVEYLDPEEFKKEYVKFVLEMQFGYDYLDGEVIFS